MLFFDIVINYYKWNQDIFVLFAKNFEKNHLKNKIIYAPVERYQNMWFSDQTSPESH